MTVYVIDAEAAIEVVRRGHSAADLECDLFAPTLMRSQVLALLHRELESGGHDPQELLGLAERACRLPRRLLGDAVMRRVAWQIATEQDWSDTYQAEYIALTRLQGDALVAASDDLRARAASLVSIVTVDSLLGRS